MSRAASMKEVVVRPASKVMERPSICTAASTVVEGQLCERPTLPTYCVTDVHGFYSHVPVPTFTLASGYLHIAVLAQ